MLLSKVWLEATNILRQSVRDDLMFTKYDSEEDILKSTNITLRGLIFVWIKFCNFANFLAFREN